MSSFSLHLIPTDPLDLLTIQFLEYSKNLFLCTLLHQLSFLCYYTLTPRHPSHLHCLLAWLHSNLTHPHTFPQLPISLLPLPQLLWSQIYRHCAQWYTVRQLAIFPQCSDSGTSQQTDLPAQLSLGKCDSSFALIKNIDVTNTNWDTQNIFSQDLENAPP